LTADADPTLAEVIALCDEARVRTGGWFDPRGLPDPRTGTRRYDPSGLVKGWAVQRAARHVAELDGCGWYLNAGGDMLVHAPADQPPWRIGIEDPNDPSRVLRVVARRDGAVATSSSARRGTHIIDPTTRRPAIDLHAVTVVGPELLWADVYATAAVARGSAALDWLDGVDRYEAMMVPAFGAIGISPGWPAS
jgi:FAD:protein FMN transferase